MLKWETIASYKNDTCNSHRLHYKEHIIQVLETKQPDTYILQWYRGASLEVQKPFTASTVDEAKAYAVAAIKNYLAERAAYWRDAKIGFANLVDDM